MTARYLRKNVNENRTQEFRDPLRSPAVNQQLQDPAEEGQVRNQRQQEIQNRVLACWQDTVGSLFAGVDLHHPIVERVVIIPNRDLVIGRGLQAVLQFSWQLLNVILALQQRVAFLAVNGKFDGVVLT